MHPYQYEAKLGKDPSGHPYKKTPLRPSPQAAGFKAAQNQVLLARTTAQARAAAQDAAEVKAFQGKVARELSKLNQMDAMAETVNFIDGPEGRKQVWSCLACSCPICVVESSALPRRDAAPLSPSLPPSLHPSIHP